jgi:mono/diheme cytochrome c family protein
MKRILIAGILSGCLAIYSCGSGSNESAHENDVVSNAEKTPLTMEGKPVPAPVETAKKEAGGLDVNAPSDSKGVGKFTEIKVGKTVDAALAAKGKELFQTSCTACHTATDQRLVGPGLKGITKIRTPEWIMNMITDPAKMTHNDAVAKALLEEFNNVQMTNQNVGDDGARAILEFLRQNDGVK